MSPIFFVDSLGQDISKRYRTLEKKMKERIIIMINGLEQFLSMEKLHYFRKKIYDGNGTYLLIHLWATKVDIDDSQFGLEIQAPV